MGFLIRALRAAFSRYESAAERGMRLLRSNLTPMQLHQNDTYRYFDVVGGETGHRYRIHHADAMNVDEFDAAGTRINKWCFLPRGNLVRGDILLAQKLALELFESEVRVIANRYPRG